jgi:hypothetical protein
MNTSSKHKVAKWVTVLCLGLVPIQNQAAEFVEISAEIETFGYRLGDTESVAEAKPRTVKVKCITGSTEWYIEHDFHLRQEWMFDGTNVVVRSRPLSGSDKDSSMVTKEIRPARDGHPMGEFGVNMPWLAFCSGPYLKREGRRIPLPCGILRHCPDRFAYPDVTTTFDDKFGLPRSVDLFTSKARFLAAHTEWDEEHGFGNRYTEWKNKTAANLQEGLLVFHYAVLESTNVVGRTFPTKFEFFQNGRPYEQMGDWFCQGVGRVRSIRPSTRLPVLE